jgi:hypothetical protein
MNQQGPYYSSQGIAETKKSVVAFIDIMGFTEAMKRAHEENKSNELLNRLRSALDLSYTYLQHPLGPERQVWALKAFTDNIVIGYPIQRDGEPELGHILDMLSFFQLEMIRAGFFIRGGIAIGDLYMDDSLVFGQGLLNAYDAETRLARDPRVILDSSAVQYVELHLSYYGSVEWSPQYRRLMRDADGQVFLNYLDGILIAAEEDGPYEEILLEHKVIVEQRLQEFGDNPRVWSKYSWAGNYHNFFCELYECFNEKHKIGEAKLRLIPQRLR